LQIVYSIKAIWIQEHGGTELGYIARYGVPSDTYGLSDDGGSAIWLADWHEYLKLLNEYKVEFDKIN